MPTKFPSEGDFVVGKVTDIQSQYVYVDLMDYEGLPSEEHAQGMMHISEISSRWIRNIRNFVRVGQRMILRVLKVDTYKGHIDLSLKRVNSAQRKNKMKEWKYALKLENILQFFADEVGISLREAYEEIAFPVLGRFNYEYQECVEELKEHGDTILEEFKDIPKDHREAFLKIVDENVEISTVSVKGELRLKYTLSDGIEKIKETLKEAIGVVENQKKTRNISISYVAAPLYRMEVTSKDYLDAESILSDALEVVEQKAEKYGGEYEFLRK